MMTRARMRYVVVQTIWIALSLGVIGCRAPGARNAFHNGFDLSRLSFRSVPEQWEPPIESDPVAESDSGKSPPAGIQTVGGTESDDDLFEEEQRKPDADSERSVWTRWLPQFGKRRRIPLPRTDLQADSESDAPTDAADRDEADF